MADFPEVRIATRHDEDEIMAMCERLAAENALFTYKADKVKLCLHKCYERKGSIVGVIGTSGHIEASLCMMISEFYYTDDIHLAELWNFVDEPYRKSHNAEALIEFGKACADKMGIPFFTGIVTNKSTAGKVRLYRRLLGYPAGAFFVYNSKWRLEPMEDHEELRNRLREAAIMCSENKITNIKAREKLGPLLREAAEVVAREDNLWGVSKKNKSNGSSHAI